MIYKIEIRAEKQYVIRIGYFLAQYLKKFKIKANILNGENDIIRIFPKKGYESGDIDKIIQSILSHNSKYVEVHEFYYSKQGEQLQLC